MDQQNIRLQAWAVLLGALLLAAKFMAYFYTNSSSILTDALESIINVAAGALGLYSLILAARPKDENHPYGHGKIEFISAGVEGTLIVLAGLLIIGQGSYRLFAGDYQLHPIDLGLYITAFAGAVNYLLGHLAEEQGKKTHSLALVASGQHLKSDAYSTLGLIFGLILIMILQYQSAESYWIRLADNIVAILFGGIIAYTGYHIIRKSLAGIMDELDYELVHKIVQDLQDNRKENWIDVHNLRIIKYGSDLHIDCHLSVPWYFDIREGHKEVEALENLLREKLSSPVELFVHLDACRTSSCQLCSKVNCLHREAEFAGQLSWTADNILLNRMHGR